MSRTIEIGTIKTIAQRFKFVAKTSLINDNLLKHKTERLDFGYNYFLSAEWPIFTYGKYRCGKVQRQLEHFHFARIIFIFPQPQIHNGSLQDSGALAFKQHHGTQ